MAKHYKIDGNKIIANVKSLTEAELKAVKNYISLGFELVEGAIKTEKKKANEDYTEEIVRKNVDEYGTKEEKKTYEDLYNKPVIDKNTGKKKVYENDVYDYDIVVNNGKTTRKTKYDENGNKIIKHKKGEEKKQGHIATLKWYKEKIVPKLPKE